MQENTLRDYGNAWAQVVSKHCLRLLSHSATPRETCRSEKVVAANAQGLTTRCLEFTTDRGVPWEKALKLYQEEVSVCVCVCFVRVY